MVIPNRYKLSVVSTQVQYLQERFGAYLRTLTGMRSEGRLLLRLHIFNLSKRDWLEMEKYFCLQRFRMNGTELAINRTLDGDTYSIAKLARLLSGKEDE